MRAHPLGVALLVLASVVSIATDPPPPPEGATQSETLSGSFDLDGTGPRTLAVAVEMVCELPAEDAAEFPMRDASVSIDAEVTPLGGPPDSSARIHVVGSARVEGDAPLPEDEQFLDEDSEPLSFGAGNLHERCADDTRCVVDVAFTFDADAAVRVDWGVAAEGRWLLERGGPCSIRVIEDGG